MYKIIIALPLVILFLSSCLVLTGKKSERVGEDNRILMAPIMSVILVSLLFGHILIVKVFTSITLIMLSAMLISIIKSNGIPYIKDEYEATDCQKITKVVEKNKQISKK